MDRPFVYLNMASTADGKITSATREYPTFTSDVDRKTMDRLRAEADAILVGAGTMRADNPRLQVRDAEMLEHRRSLGKPDRLLKILVTASARIDPRNRFFSDEDGEERIVATTENAAPENLEALSGKAEVWQLGRDRVDLTQLLHRLYGRGVLRLLVEGGGEMNWGFVSLDLVDEIYVTVAPSLLGGRDAPTLLEGEGFGMKDAPRLRLLEVHTEGDEIFCRYAVVR